MAFERRKEQGKDGVQSEILRTLGTLKYVRIWRAATGKAKFGGVTEADVLEAIHVGQGGGTKQQVLEHLRVCMGKPSARVQFGMIGQADLTGYICVKHGELSRLIVCDVMEVSAFPRYGIRLEVEAKSETGRQRKDQKTYQAMVERGGGIYILARSGDEAKMLLHSKLIERGIKCTID